MVVELIKLPVLKLLSPRYLVHLMEIGLIMELLLKYSMVRQMDNIGWV